MNLSEFKALLGHEFGHFAQRTSALTRWIYTSQQILARLAGDATGIGRGLFRMIRSPRSIMELLVWPFTLVIGLTLWAIRTLTDIVLRLLVISARALGRELEFQADTVAVSVSGSEPIVSLLSKLDAIEQSWHQTIRIAQRQAQRGAAPIDLIDMQNAVMERLRDLYIDGSFGRAPASK